MVNNRFYSLAIFPVLALWSSAAAQDTSNVVGYSTLQLGEGAHLIGSPFSAKPPSEASALQKELLDNFWPAGTAFSLWSNGSFENYQFDGTVWTDPVGQITTTITLLPWEGALLTLPSAYDFVTSGSLLYFDLESEPGTVASFLPLIPGAPYAPGIHLLNNLNPVGTVSFDEVIGRAPAEGDSVLQIDLAGNEQVSRYLEGSWVGPAGQNLDPILDVGEAAFFDLSGQQFSGFNLNASVVPEPSGILLIMLSTLLAYRRKR